jgi:2-methylcitrate dehydratase PrpD
VANLPGLSGRLAHHVATSAAGGLQPTAAAATRRALLDAIGVMSAASGLCPAVLPFVAMARAAGGSACASILGTGDRAPADSAALANGAMAHALDYEDAFDEVPVHPNASLVPAALALAQADPTVGDGEFLAAMAVGCDVSCRLALGVGRAMERGPWYPPPVIGAFGAVAAAARLLRLDERQVLDAFSLMLCQVACPGGIRHGGDSALRAVREAFPARAAVTAALLARDGVRGLEQPIEGPGGFLQMFAGGECDTESLLDGLGSHLLVESLSFKPWPCCRGTHPYLEAAQQLRARHAFDAGDVQAIRVQHGPVQQMLCEPIGRKRAPANPTDAKFSIPFVVATALARPEVTLDSFLPEALCDPAVLRIAALVDCERRDDIGPTSGRLEVILAGGQRLPARVDQALGHPDRPMGEARLRAKFVDCSARAAKPLDAAAADALATRIMALGEGASFAASIGL